MDENKNYFKITGIFLVGLIIGTLITSQLVSNSAKDIKILYVSQDEIIDLEKERIEKMDNKDNIQLFYGEPDHAVGLIELFAAEYGHENAENMVVFSRGPVSGERVKSISAELHKRVIKELNIMIVGGQK